MASGVESQEQEQEQTAGAGKTDLLLLSARASGKNDSEIADVCAGGAGDDEVVELFEEGVGVAAGEILGGVEIEFARACERGFVCDGAGGGAVAVDAVSAGAQDHDVVLLFVQSDGAAQSGFEIAPTASIASHGAGELAA
jgi:hypothetical protein